MEHLIDDIDNSLSSVKPFHHHVTCLLDLPDEILLIICRYLSPFHVLYCFYTPERPELRLHHVIYNYYTKFKLDGMNFLQYRNFIGLFSNKTFPPQPQSLTLSDEHVSCLIEISIFYINLETFRSIFTNLIHLTLINCSSEKFRTIDRDWLGHLTQLKYLHIKKLGNIDGEIIEHYTEKSNTFITRLLFYGKMFFLHTLKIESYGAYSFHKALTSHKNLRHIEIVLQTIDDLHILLNQLVPNIQNMIVQLNGKRILTHRHPQCKSSCPQLTEFTLLEHCSGLIIDDIKSILCYMPSLIKLALSIHDTPDPIFCHGLKFESILIEHLPCLRQFDYTMTHKIAEQTLIKDFVRWPMNIFFYENENCKWIRIYSLPWPSNKDDQRRIPIINGRFIISVESDFKRVKYMKRVIITEHKELLELKTDFLHAFQIRTCLEIDIVLPIRISKLILSKETPVSSINSIVQPSISHLIVKRRLIDENEIGILAHQFPNVKYLELLFPSDKSSFVCCFKTLFSMDDNSDKRCFWLELINFCTIYDYDQATSISGDGGFHSWLINNTDLKFHSIPFYSYKSYSMLSIWL